MGSGQPYMKSGVFSRLKHTLLHGRVPVWAFLLVAGLLLLRLVSLAMQTSLVKTKLIACSCPTARVL
jgi:hypothetical protein